MAIDIDQHLAESLETHKMKHIQEKVDAFKAKADEVKGKLESHYGSDVYYNFRSGSFAKHTAINIKFDFGLFLFSEALCICLLVMTFLTCTTVKTPFIEYASYFDYVQMSTLPWGKSYSPTMRIPSSLYPECSDHLQELSSRIRRQRA